MTLSKKNMFLIGWALLSTLMVGIHGDVIFTIAYATTFLTIMIQVPENE